jgi:vacuolar protein sorting-associated protein 54
LTQVGSLYDALQRAKDAEEEEAPRILRRKGSRMDDFADLLDSSEKVSNRKPDSRKASLASLASLSPDTRRRSNAGLGRRLAHTPAPLSTIPNVYFDDDFHLENPRTFDVVSERSEVVRPVVGSPEERKAPNGSILAPRKALATNAILQEKLSWYMDTIEIHLIASISTASSSFFAALGSLRELHHEASESVERIKALRRELQALDKEMAVGGLDIINMRRKRENLKQLSNAVQQLKCIVEGVSVCESLVDDGQVERALDAMDALESLIAGEQSEIDAELLDMNKQQHLRDLSAATALQGVNNDLDTLRYKIGRVFETRFLNALLGDLRRHIEAVPVKDTLQRWSNASQRSRGGHNREPSAFPTYMTLNNEFRAELLANLNGLHRAKHTSPATSAYRESVLREIKTIIKRPLPSSNDDDNDSMMSASTLGGKQLSQQERSSILARNLRALEPGVAEETLVKIYIGVGESLRRLGTQVKVLLDVTSTLGDSSGGTGPMSPLRSPNMAVIDARMSASDQGPKSSARQIQEEMHQALDMSNLLGQAVDIAQNQIVKVLRVRTEQSVGQTLTRFLRYFTLNLLFANECEAVSGRGGTALKTVVNGQIKDFVKQFGEPCQRKLADAMDSDLWNAKDFTEQDTAILSRILEGSDRDPESWTIGGKIWLPYEEPLPESSNGVMNGTTTNGATKEKVRQAVIESDSFMLPASAIVCLQGLEPFLQLITGIPSMTTDVAPHIISYLQVFNSKCTQLILGAGATRSVGLKNITTKHLALASQSLSFISTLIPHIREFVRRHAGSGPAVSTMMGEFDKVRRTYQEHQNSISDKLVDIMSGRASTHVKAMKTINWDDSADNGINPYMDTLVKETTTLHKVLSRHLPDITVLMIMEPVFKSYKDQWGKAYGDVILETEGGQQKYEICC